MKSYIFEVQENSDYGGLGLLLLGQKNYDPLGGMGAAHDILEHFPNDQGDSEGEFMALGAAMFIREDGGYQHYARRFEVVYDAPPDLLRTYGYHLEREYGRELRIPPMCRDAAVRERAYEVMCAFKKLNREEAQFSENPPTEQFCLRMAGWFAHGYQRAKRRYRKLGACGTAYLFKCIENDLDKFLKHGEEGQRVKVTVNLRRQQYKCRELGYGGEDY